MRRPSATTVLSWAMRPSATTAARFGISAIVALRKSRHSLISVPTGLFSGGTQRTALVMRVSCRARPSSGRAAKVPVENPNRDSVA